MGTLRRFFERFKPRKPGDHTPKPLAFRAPVPKNEDRAMAARRRANTVGAFGSKKPFRASKSYTGYNYGD